MNRQTADRLGIGADFVILREQAGQSLYHRIRIVLPIMQGRQRIGCLTLAGCYV